MTREHNKYIKYKRQHGAIDIRSEPTVINIFEGYILVQLDDRSSRPLSAAKAY